MEPVDAPTGLPAQVDPLPEHYIRPMSSMESTDVDHQGQSFPAVPLRAHKRDLWGLTLEARGIPFEYERGGRNIIFVPEAHLSTALDEIRALEEENQTVLPRFAPARRAEHKADVSIFLAAIGLIAIHLASRRGWMAVGAIPTGPSPDIKLLGWADSSLILAGEWWRTVTALTLHADAAHLMGNVAVGAIFVSLLCREVGRGPAWLATLLSGALGNLVNALVRGPGHLSLGASTAVFGAVGALGMAQAVRNLLSSGRWRGEWKQLVLPGAAGLAFLAMLGSGGERTDLGAHLFGFGAGLLLGGLAGYLTTRFGAPSRFWNLAMSLAALAVCVAAWGRALGL